jgi:hypothetical protein
VDGRNGPNPQRTRRLHGGIHHHHCPDRCHRHVRTPLPGGTINDQLGVGGLSVQHGDYVAGDCPDGNWTLTHVNDAPERKGGDVNQNGDNYVCIKGDPQGEGNTGNNSNNKDNNSDPVDNG